MTMLKVRAREECRFDLVALGEVMLRLDPGEGRIRDGALFQAWEGGGEYNVARGLRRCFGLRTAVATALADNEVGRLVEDLILQGGVDTSLLQWRPDDGVGRAVRNGLNFTERGFGVRGARRRVRPRQHRGQPAAARRHRLGRTSSASLGVRWFHTGGIFAGLSPPRRTWSRKPSRPRGGTARSSPTTSTTGPASGRARRPQPAHEVNRELAQHVDVMIGNEEDFTAALGFEVAGRRRRLSRPRRRELQGR